MPNSLFKQYLLGDLIFEQKERAGKNINNLTVYGVDRKVGITTESKYQSEKINKYKILRNGMFAYNPMRLNIGSIGFCHSKLNEGLVSPDYVVFGCNEELLIPEYLRYLIQSDTWNSWVESAGVGSVRVRIYYRELVTMPIQIPPIQYQLKIVSILKSIDNKIELNRQINQTLEQIAQAIFKSWFVDFEPTRAKIAAKQNGTDPERAAMAALSGKTLDELDQLSPATRQQLKETAALFPDTLVDSELGEIPAGWEVRPLNDLIEFNPKRTLKKGTLAPYLDMKNMPTKGHLANDVYLREMASGTKYIQGDTLLARITPCLENGKTAYVDFLDEEQVGWGSTEYIVMRPKNDRPLSLGYMIARLESFRSKAIQTMTGTSGRQRANAKAISEQSWIDYPEKLLQRFNQFSGSYLNKAKINGDQNKSLSELRDTLLPKLLSGELSVESAAEAAHV